jgi:hypothetical protein
MDRLGRLVALGLALSGALLFSSCGPSKSSGSAGAGSLNVLCMTDPSLPTVKVSAVFPIKTADPSEPWTAEYRRYIAQSGSEGGVEVVCQAVNSSLKDAEQPLKDQGKKIVETGWKYAN